MAYCMAHAWHMHRTPTHARRIHRHGTYRHRADESHGALLLYEKRRSALDELGKRVGVNLVLEKAALIIYLAGEVCRRQKLPLHKVSAHDLRHLGGRQIAQLLSHHLAARRDRSSGSQQRGRRAAQEQLPATDLGWSGR